MRRSLAAKVAIIATHPIQYYAPLFRVLTQRARVRPRVFYGWSGGATDATLDRGFGQPVQWDLPLLDGYDHTFVPNRSTDAGTHHYAGIWSERLIPDIEAWSPDALIVYGWNYRSHLQALRAFHNRIPILFRGDSTLEGAGSKPRRWVRYLFLRWVYRHVDAALYVGQLNELYYRRHGLSDDRLFWAPHAVDNDRYGDRTGVFENEALGWRRELGIGSSDLVFLYAGKLEYNKGPDLLLEAFLSRARGDEHLVIVGSGELEPSLRELAAHRPNVHFLGFQNQSRMPVVYRLGNVFVMPSRGPIETWGLAVNEAMASARPVIVSDCVGCAPDLVIEGTTGLVFRRKDVGALSRAMSTIGENAERRAEMAVAAARHIATWSLTEQARRIEEAVEQVIDRMHCASLEHRR